MGTFVVIVLDGFGVGAMADVAEVRPADLGSNTCAHIFERVPGLRLPTLQRLGLGNAAGGHVPGLPPSETATWGRARLTHYWADTFFGHQEIMGTRPQVPLVSPSRARSTPFATRLLPPGTRWRCEPSPRDCDSSW